MERITTSEEVIAASLNLRDVVRALQLSRQSAIDMFKLDIVDKLPDSNLSLNAYAYGCRDLMFKLILRQHCTLVIRNRSGELFSTNSAQRFLPHFARMTMKDREGCECVYAWGSHSDLHRRRADDLALWTAWTTWGGV